MAVQEIFAVAYEETITIPGDARSISHPGHGYPEHTVTNRIFKEFPDRTAFDNWIREETGKTYGRRKFQAYICKPVQISTEVIIKMD